VSLLGGHVKANELALRITDGEENMIFSFSSTPTVTFEQGILLVSSGEGEVEYPMSRAVIFDFVDISGIEGEINNDLKIAISYSTINLSGLRVGTTVSIYGMDGMNYYSSAVDSTGEMIISMENLPSAPMILKAGNKTFKFIKK
ncbi:MAG: hypothetical protein K2G23_02105, partial [Muribaculaceae bacterium]|nr:hypothetical protein [Muribaculaceae bacterium]